MFTCPVCGFPGLSEPAYDPTNAPSFDICPSCGTEFGYQDMKRSHADLREDWIAAGCLWTGNIKDKPQDWDPKEQMRRAGLLS